MAVILPFFSPMLALLLPLNLQGRNPTSERSKYLVTDASPFDNQLF
jgi:hypothetical protein